MLAKITKNIDLTLIQKSEGRSGVPTKWVRDLQVVGPMQHRDTRYP